MSKVYSFRLDESNPREAQAMEVINAWVCNGYSLRHILTEALNKLDDGNDPLDGIDQLMVQLREMIEGSSKEMKDVNIEDRTSTSLPLSSTFLAEIGNSLKGRLRITSK